MEQILGMEKRAEFCGSQDGSEQLDVDGSLRMGNQVSCQ